MSEMIERVARAISIRMGEFPCTDQDCARAAIEAMREPTEAMSEDGYGQAGCSKAHCTAVYSAMIEAALK